MELKEFIKGALSEIDEALDETSKKYEKYNYKYGKNSAGFPTIDFEIQVYASEGKKTDGGIGINVAGIKLGSNGESKNDNHQLSTLKFSVVRENTPKQDEIERIEKLENLPDITTQKSQMW